MSAGGAGEAAEDGGGVAAAFVADEQAVLAVQGDALHFLLSEVVVDGDGAVGQEGRQGFPLIQHIADRLSHRMLGEQGLLPHRQLVA